MTMAQEEGPNPRNQDEYTVGWVCALPKEQTAATAMLDTQHEPLPKPANDHNAYTLGSIGNHNVVITCLPLGRIGNNSSATVAMQMLSTFPSIKFGLMVGIGGGIPPKVRLGDVVVSTPTDEFPGVVQWDMGKVEQGGRLRRTQSLNNPPSTLLTALTTLQTRHEMQGSRIPQYLDDLEKKWPRLAARYSRSDSLEDVLYAADVPHCSSTAIHEAEAMAIDDEGEEQDNCRFCDKGRIAKRRPRDMRVHYGLIASGNRVVMDAGFRDELN